MTDAPDETEAAWVRRFSGITHAQAEILMADTRDKRRARLRKRADELTLAGAESVHGNNVSADPAYVISVAADISAELKASQRDRAALADARDLICNSAPLAWVNNPDYADDAQQWEKRAEAFLKSTEPTDD